MIRDRLRSEGVSQFLHYVSLSWFWYVYAILMCTSVSSEAWTLFGMYYRMEWLSTNTQAGPEIAHKPPPWRANGNADYFSSCSNAGGWSVASQATLRRYFVALRSEVHSWWPHKRASISLIRPIHTFRSPVIVTMPDRRPLETSIGNSIINSSYKINNQ